MHMVMLSDHLSRELQYSKVMRYNHTLYGETMTLTTLIKLMITVFENVVQSNYHAVLLQLREPLTLQEQVLKDNTDLQPSETRLILCKCDLLVQFFIPSMTK